MARKFLELDLSFLGEESEDEPGPSPAATAAAAPLPGIPSSPTSTQRSETSDLVFFFYYNFFFLFVSKKHSINKVEFLIVDGFPFPPSPFLFFFL